MSPRGAAETGAVGTPWLSWALALAGAAALFAAHPPIGLRVLAFLVPALVAGAVLTGPARVRHGVASVALAYAVGHLALLTWLIPAAGVGAWLLLALVQGAWGAGLGALLAAARRWPLAFAPLSALAWVGIDAWRGSVPLGGFAWGTLASAQVGDGWLRPLLRLGGEHLMTLVIVLLGVAAAQTVLAVCRHATAEGTPDVDAWISAFPAGRVGVTWLVGTAAVATLATVEPPAPTAELDVLAVQPWDREDVDGTRAWDRQLARQALELTRRSIDEDGVPDLTVWPETTVNHDPGTDPEIAATLAEGGRVTNGTLLAGVKRDGPDPERTWFNTAALIGADGETIQDYRKRRPVPFGEYVPFRSLVDWIPPLAQVPRDMLRGDGPQQVRVGDVPVAVAICFESLFPEVVRSNVLAGDDTAEVIVVSTYDGSFGRVGQAAQHLDQSRLRAVETGRWVVHAGASGLTAFVSPTGQVEDVTELFTSAYRRRTVPLVEGRTPFLATGDLVGSTTRLMVLAGGAAGLVLAVRRRREVAPDASSRDTPMSDA